MPLQGIILHDATKLERKQIWAPIHDNLAVNNGYKTDWQPATDQYTSFPWPTNVSATHGSDMWPLRRCRQVAVFQQCLDAGSQFRSTILGHWLVKWATRI